MGIGALRRNYKPAAVESEALPPENGRGSGLAAWQAYAAQAGLEVEGLTRDGIIALATADVEVEADAATDAEAEPATEAEADAPADVTPAE